jgi:hypothetical protein
VRKQCPQTDTSVAKARAKKPGASNAAVTRVLPMQLKQGDRLVDETGEWEIIGRPYTTNAGKNASVRVKKAGQAEVTEIRSWGAA